MRRTHNLMVPAGTYTDSDGKEKARWIRVGTMMENDKGLPVIKLDAIPAGEWNGWINAYPPKDPTEQAKNTRAKQERQQADPYDGFNDDIPL